MNRLSIIAAQIERQERANLRAERERLEFKHINRLERMRQRAINTPEGRLLTEITQTEYERGRRDCELGEPHQPGQPEGYDHGYSDQYEREQRVSQ